MIKTEKVIKGLECCNSLHNDSIVKCATDCPYWEFDANCRGFVIRDALALLKAQEPVEPTLRGGIGGYWYCGACNYQISRGDKFCRYCGQAVKWK